MDAAYFVLSTWILPYRCLSLSTPPFKSERRLGRNGGWLHEERMRALAPAPHAPGRDAMRHSSPTGLNNQRGKSRKKSYQPLVERTLPHGPPVACDHTRGMLSCLEVGGQQLAIFKTILGGGGFFRILSPCLPMMDQTVAVDSRQSGERLPLAAQAMKGQETTRELRQVGNRA